MPPKNLRADVGGDPPRLALQTGAGLLRLLADQPLLLADLAEINRQFAQELDRRTGVVTAEVTTARPVPEAEREALRARLGQLTGRSVRLQFAMDEDLIGGVVTRIGSTVYDGSVRTQLEQLKQRIAGGQ